MLRETSKLNKVLLALRVATILFGITGACGLGWAATQEYAFYGDGLGQFCDMLLSIGLGVSFVWSAIVLLITILFKVPIHPGVFIGIDILFAMYFFAIGVLVAASPVNGVDDLTCDGPAWFCDPIEDRTIIWRWVGATLCFLSCICHLAFFSCACRVCTVRRKEEKQKQSVGADSNSA